MGVEAPPVVVSVLVTTVAEAVVDVVEVVEVEVEVLAAEAKVAAAVEDEMVRVAEAVRVRECQR